jgi:hypothetical protein
MAERWEIIRRKVAAVLEAKRDEIASDEDAAGNASN